MTCTLPHSYYDHLAGCSEFRIAAVCAGIPRSATTMIYQIMRDLFPGGGVVKTHGWLDVPLDVPVVATVRDFRDAAVSWWRVRYAQEIERNAREMAKQLDRVGGWSFFVQQQAVWQPSLLSMEDTVRLAGEFRQWVFWLDQYVLDPKRIGRFLLLRYEDLVRDPQAACQSLSRVLGRECTPQVIEAHDLRHNWGLKRFTDQPVYGWDAATATGPIPNGHCHEGGVGTWQGFCDDKTSRVLTMLLQDELWRYGYIKGDEMEPSPPLATREAIEACFPKDG